MFTIQSLTITSSIATRESLIDLLCDSVEGGASVGFLVPLQRDDAAAYWQSVFNELSSPLRVILAATTDNGEVAGSV